MLVMQQLLMDETGETFPALMHRLVLKPLGMTRSTFEQPLPAAQRSQAASGHDGQGAVINGKWRVHPEQAAAGLWTTPGDLARWAIAIADAWTGRSGRIMSRSMATAMLTRQQDQWGLGVEVEGSGDSLWFGHDGANRGFRAELVMFPALGKGAVVMTNADRGSELIAEVFHSIAVENGWPGYHPIARTIAHVEGGLLDSVVGRYDPHLPSPWSETRVEVTRHDISMFLEAAPNFPKSEIYPASTDSFFTLSGAEVVFKRNRNGRGIQVILGGSIVADRVR